MGKERSVSASPCFQVLLQVIAEKVKTPVLEWFDRSENWTITRTESLPKAPETLRGPEGKPAALQPPQFLAPVGSCSAWPPTWHSDTHVRKARSSHVQMCFRRFPPALQLQLLSLFLLHSQSTRTHHYSLPLGSTKSSSNTGKTGHQEN